jgi:DNA topoisomerase-1
MLSTDPLASAEEAGLRYVRAEGPCVRRIRCGKAFRYIGPDGRPLRDPRHLQRIRSLAIPPAWTNVWICPSAAGHIQAVGWDAKGRKQYRYHARYRSVRDDAKFSRMIAFGTVLAIIRNRVREDLQRPGLPKEKVLATAVRLLETTFIRVGNDEYAKENASFGLTTMRGKHVRINGTKLMFRFRGKSGQEHTIELKDARLARIVQQCQDLPGYELFQYVNDAGEVCRIDSGDVNDYIRESAARISRRRIFAPGRERSWRLVNFTRPARAPERRAPKARWCSASRTWRGSWETGRRLAANTTFIRRFSTPGRMGACSPPCSRVSSRMPLMRGSDSGRRSIR